MTMGIYNKLDRYLPFDKYLDPLFERDVPRRARGGAPLVPQRAPQRIDGIDPTMGFGQLPGAGEPPKKRVPKVSKLRVLDRVLGGQTFTDAIDEERARPMREARIAEIRASLPPDQQMLFDLSPEAWVKAYGGPPQAPQAPAYIEGPDGIYERGEDGWTKATAYPDAAPKPPERIEGPDGIYEKGPDGQWKKVATFGAAPKMFAPPRAGGSPRAPAGAPTADRSAIEAELRRRGLLR